MEKAHSTPDFFIVGAPKCATTALAYYLAQHPEIGMCRKKDTAFLTHAEPGQLIDDPGYLALFAGLEGKQRIGDASVLSLYSERAMTNISSLCASPKIIVSLRRPAEMLPALHAQQMRNSGAPAETFEQTWRAESDGAALSTSLARAPDPPGTYRAAGRYAEPVRRYIEAFGAADVLVLDFAELTNDTAEQVADVYRFLGVNPGFVPETPVVNAHHRLRFRWFRRFVYAPPPALSRAVRAVFSDRQRAAIAARLVKFNAAFNRVAEEPRPIPEHLHEELVSEFEQDQKDLAAVLAQWRKENSGVVADEPAVARPGGSTSSR